MSWLLLGILIYTLAGAVLVMRCMRGMDVKASLGEWLKIIFLWPLMLRFFAHLTMVQAMVRNFESVAKKLEKDPE